jgi:hypothetical protein
MKAARGVGFSCRKHSIVVSNLPRTIKWKSPGIESTPTNRTKKTPRAFNEEAELPHFDPGFNYDIGDQLQVLTYLKRIIHKPSQLQKNLKKVVHIIQTRKESVKYTLPLSLEQLKNKTWIRETFGEFIPVGSLGFAPVAATTWEMRIKDNGYIFNTFVQVTGHTEAIAHVLQYHMRQKYGMCPLMVVPKPGLIVLEGNVVNRVSSVLNSLFSVYQDLPNVLPRRGPRPDSTWFETMTRPRFL